MIINKGLNLTCAKHNFVKKLTRFLDTEDYKKFFYSAKVTLYYEPHPHPNPTNINV